MNSPEQNKAPNNSEIKKNDDDNMKVDKSLDFVKWILTQDEKYLKNSCEYLMEQNPDMDVLREALEEAAKNPLYPGKTWTLDELDYLGQSLHAHDTKYRKRAFELTTFFNSHLKNTPFRGQEINEKKYDLNYVLKRDNNFIPRIIAIENAKITPQPIAIEAAEPGFVEKIIDKLREARNYYKQPGESTSPSKKPKPP